jgi:hypothetical protein
MIAPDFLLGIFLAVSSFAKLQGRAVEIIFASETV